MFLPGLIIHGLIIMQPRPPFFTHLCVIWPTISPLFFSAYCPLLAPTFFSVILTCSAFCLRMFLFHSLHSGVNSLFATPSLGSKLREFLPIAIQLSHHAFRWVRLLWPPVPFLVVLFGVVFFLYHPNLFRLLVVWCTYRFVAFCVGEQ